MPVQVVDDKIQCWGEENGGATGPPGRRKGPLEALLPHHQLRRRIVK